MPFDALVRSPLTLADAASDLGITPIPAEVLAEHKRTEQAKYPPASFGYHHLKALRMGIGVATVITMVLILIGTVGFMRGDHYSSLWGLATLPFVLAIWASAKVMRGPAIWVEYVPAYVRVEAPQPILMMAFRLMRQMPGSHIVIGELRQDSVVLDPYLLVRTATEEVCIGIWDGRDILHQATQKRN